MQPRTSVVLPVYNGGCFLAEAIESVLSQTDTDFEFVIVDDGSTDDTPDKLSPDFFEGSARICVAALASLAGASSPSVVLEASVGGVFLSASPNPFNGQVVLHLMTGGAEGPQSVAVWPNP